MHDQEQALSFVYWPAALAVSYFDLLGMAVCNYDSLGAVGAVVATLPRAGTQHTDLFLAVERA